MRGGRGSQRSSGSRATLRKIGAELRDNPPSVLRSTKRKFGAKRAEAQRRAILLSKARKSGAKVPY